MADTTAANQTSQEAPGPLRSLAIAERNVPRYTSYPTAPHFSAAIGPEVYAGWLEQLPREATLSLYIHVPFCT